MVDQFKKKPYENAWHKFKHRIDVGIIIGSLAKNWNDFFLTLDWTLVEELCGSRGNLLEVTIEEIGGRTSEKKYLEAFLG